MAVTAVIQFTQNAVVGPAGQAFIGVTGLAVTAANDDDTGVIGWRWILTDVPQGENVGEDSALPAGTVLSVAAGASFIPDVPGTYQLELRVTEDGLTFVTSINSFLVPDEFGVIKPGHLARQAYLDLGMLLDRGWTQIMERLFSFVRRLGLIGYRRTEIYSGVSGVQDTNAAIFVTVGSFSFDPSVLPAAGVAGVTRTVIFEAMIWATAGMTVEIQLWNTTDAAIVAGTILSSILNTPELVKSVNLAVPAVIPNAERMYEVQIRISAGVPLPVDRALCGMARLNVSWT